MILELLLGGAILLTSIDMGIADSHLYFWLMFLAVAVVPPVAYSYFTNGRTWRFRAIGALLIAVYVGLLWPISPLSVFAHCVIGGMWWGWATLIYLRRKFRQGGDQD